MKKKLIILGIVLGLAFTGIVMAQTAYQGFNKLHYEQLLRSGECPGCMLYQGRFSRLDLSGANLRGALLVGARFRGTLLQGADLLGASVRGADFSGANLSGATWVDGRTCQDDSIGYCKSERE